MAGSSPEGPPALGGQLRAPSLSAAPTPLEPPPGVGPGGFEPPPPVPKTGVLPLDDGPITFSHHGNPTDGCVLVQSPHRTGAVTTSAPQGGDGGHFRGLRGPPTPSYGASPPESSGSGMRSRLRVASHRTPGKALSSASFAALASSSPP